MFEVDLHAGELRKAGRRLPLQKQPFDVLVLLLARPSEVVSREAIREALWPDQTTVDFGHSVNKAISKLREALDDSARSPRFIETLPQRGYRFIGTVDQTAAESNPSPRRIGSRASTTHSCCYPLDASTPRPTR